MHKYRLLIALFALCSSELVASDNEFYITNTFFEGEEVLFFSENRGGAIVVIDGGKLFLMSKQQEFTEVTQHFSQQIRMDISSVESVNEQTFYIGTNQNSLHLYSNGDVASIQDINNGFPSQINSIDFKGSSYNTPMVMVATDHNVYVSSDLENFEPYNLSYTKSTTFYGDRDLILLTEYPFCTQVPGDLGLQYSFSSNTVLFRVHENDTISFETLNDVMIARRGFGSWPYNSYAMYATENGVYTQHVHSCSKEVFRHYDNIETYDFELIKGALENQIIMTASESGLSYLEASAVYFDIYNPEYIQVSDVQNPRSVEYSRFHNNIWVGTTSGLKLLQQDNLIRESFEVEIEDIDTIKFCQNEGWWLSTRLNDQFDMQWYRNGEIIEGAISTRYQAFEEGTYSIRYSENQEFNQHDVAYLLLDSDFEERINKETNSVLCPNDTHTTLRFDPIDSRHEYSWYSVQRGLEYENDHNPNFFSATEEGDFYFTATNCNGFTYTSDTINVIKSMLQNPEFSSSIAGSRFCAGDTIFFREDVEVVDFEWRADNSYAGNDPHLVLTKELSEARIELRVRDELGCQASVTSEIDYVLEPPFIPSNELSFEGCDSTGFNIYLNVPFGSKAIWEGDTNGVLLDAMIGVYPVTLTNEVCPDFNDLFYIDLYDPLPFSVTDTLFQVGDTLKIPQNIYLSSLDPLLEFNTNGYYYFLTSDIEQVVSLKIVYGGVCMREYDLNIHFVDQILSAEMKEADFAIYPNPAINSLDIRTQGHKVESIELIDMMGKKISFNVSKNQDLSIHVQLPSGLKAGTYIIRLNYVNGHSAFQKVIIE